MKRVVSGLLSSRSPVEPRTYTWAGGGGGGSPPGSDEKFHTFILAFRPPLAAVQPTIPDGPPRTCPMPTFHLEVWRMLPKVAEFASEMVSSPVSSEESPGVPLSLTR